MAFKLKNKQIKEIVGQLRKASKTHAAQADKIESAMQLKSPMQKKDACYYKVKSRYKVWPSAYASRALSKCRKVGAANWGNKSKKK